LENGADADKFIEYYSTCGDIETVKFLVEKGAEASKVDLSGAVKHKHLSVVKFVVENGADADKFIEYYSTCGDIETVKFLVEKGAEASKVDLSGAVKNKHLNVIKFLVETGADANQVIEYCSSSGFINTVK